MATRFAGVMGFTAYFLAIAHGLLSGNGPDAALKTAWIFLWIFTAVGLVCGLVAEQAVRESVQAMVKAEVDEAEQQTAAPEK